MTVVSPINVMACVRSGDVLIEVLHVGYPWGACS